MNLKQMVENPDTKSGKRFALFIQFLIVLSIVDFSIGTLPGLSPALEFALSAIEACVVAVFTAEYAVRFWVADNKWKFVFSFFGLIDLLAIVPYYFGLAVDLRGLRVVRLLRVFQILKFARYTRALKRIRTALATIKEPLVVYLVATVLLIYLASVGIYYFERDAQPEYFGSVFHAMWWSISTLTTVGYGDVYPVTLGGRVFTGLVLVFGLGVISVPSALMAAALVEHDSSRKQ